VPPGIDPDLGALPGRAGEVARRRPPAAPVADVGLSAGEDDVEGRDTGAEAASSSRRRFDRLPQTKSRAPSADTANPAGISSARRGAPAGGSGIECEGSTMPSGSTVKTLTLPLTLLM
jgi:hypothetical protein